MIISNIEIITPDIAKYYLKKNNNNRAISNKIVSLYACEMNDGHWTTHHQGIAFYEDGTLADGQHRLHAVVKSGASIEMMVSRGLVHGKDIDQHKKRTMPDAIRIGRLSDIATKDVVAMYNLMCKSIADGSSVRKSTITEVAAFANRYKDNILFIQSLHFVRSRSLGNIAIKAGVFRADVWGENRDRLGQFVEIFSYGKTTNEQNMGAIVLRNHVIMNANIFAGHYERVNLDKKCQYAVRCFLDKKSITKIMTPKQHIYPIGL